MLNKLSLLILKESLKLNAKKKQFSMYFWCSDWTPDNILQYNDNVEWNKNSENSDLFAFNVKQFYAKRIPLKIILKTLIFSIFVIIPRFFFILCQKNLISRDCDFFQSQQFLIKECFMKNICSLIYIFKQFLCFYNKFYL